MLNFISSTYSIHISLLTDCSFFSTIVFCAHFIVVSQLIFLVVVVVHLFVFDDGIIHM